MKDPDNTLAKDLEAIDRFYKNNTEFQTKVPQRMDMVKIDDHEMTDFERELAQAILGALEHRGFYDCGKYLDASLIEHIRPLVYQDRASLHTNLVAAVEGKKRPISVDDLAVNDIHEVYKDGYNAALDDTLTIINSIFKE